MISLANTIKANMGMPELWHQAPFWQHGLQQN